MNRRPLIAVTLLAALGSCNAINGPRGGPIILPMPNRSAEMQFDRIKALEGSWEWAEELGPELVGLVCTYEVTAGGTAILETLFPGDDFEMVSLYHLDGDQLILTHYSTTGNQPTMRAKQEKLEPGQVDAPIEFFCIGGTNMGTEADGHMHHVSFLDIQQSELLTSWTFQVDRKPAGDRVFKLSRAPQAVAKEVWVCSTCQDANLDDAIQEAQDHLRELEESQTKLQADTSPAATPLEDAPH